MRNTQRNSSGRRARRTGQKGTVAGQEIIGALNELARVLESGEPLERRFTVRTVTLPDDPRPYGPAAIRATRRRVGSSQGVFARLIGVSTILVQQAAHEQRVSPRGGRVQVRPLPGRL